MSSVPSGPATALPPLHRLTIAEVSSLLQAKRLSAVEYTQALIQRIDTLEPQINAFITPTTTQAGA
jgi:aspartyl-tRNA(Asn)/glutamyl-tRNA(Gln) amidotransferase subunit A